MQVSLVDRIRTGEDPTLEFRRIEIAGRSDRSPAVEDGANELEAGVNSRAGMKVAGNRRQAQGRQSVTDPTHEQRHPSRLDGTHPIGKRLLTMSHAHAARRSHPLAWKQVGAG